jgi:hypothetical protein
MKTCTLTLTLLGFIVDTLYSGRVASVHVIERGSWVASFWNQGMNFTGERPNFTDMRLYSTLLCPPRHHTRRSSSSLAAYTYYSTPRRGASSSPELHAVVEKSTTHTQTRSCVISRCLSHHHHHPARSWRANVLSPCCWTRWGSLPADSCPSAGSLLIPMISFFTPPWASCHPRTVETPNFERHGKLWGVIPCTIHSSFGRSMYNI